METTANLTSGVFSGLSGPEQAIGTSTNQIGVRAMTEIKTRNDGAYTYQADDRLAEKINRADHLASRYLADANEAEEAGNAAKAEKLFAKAQYWLDRHNKLIGNG